MRKYFTYAFLASVMISACSSEVNSSVERKSATVTPTGYVDLIPPTNYSPIRGVICESLNVTDGHLSGACFDLNGPSEKWTKEYISPQAAYNLLENYQYLFDPDKGYFEMKTEVACDLELRECRYIKNSNFENAESMVAHSAALFGFPPEY